MTTYRPIRPENPAKKALRAYIPLRKRRDMLQAEIETHYDRAYSCTVRLNPMKGSGGGAAYDRMAEDICRAADAKEQLRAKVEELNVTLKHILRLIDIPEDERQRTILTMRYINGLSWEDIQDRMGYERTQVYVLHGRALAAVNRALVGSGQ